MNIVEESIVIDKPRKVVFDFFADPSTVTLYSSNVVEYDVVSGGPTEIGRKAKLAVKVAGVRLEYTDELTEFEDGAAMTLRATEGRIPYTLRMSVADVGEGTRVTFHQETESFGGVFKFADKLVLKMYSRDVRGNLENAKVLLEE